MPKDIDENVASLKLTAMDIALETLTPEQEKYLASWDMGTASISKATMTPWRTDPPRCHLFLKDRPGIIYILQGTITDHRNGVATASGPGVGWPEDRNTTHWLENRGTIPAVEISVDIVRQE